MCVLCLFVCVVFCFVLVYDLVEGNWGNCLLVPVLFDCCWCVRCVFVLSVCLLVL